MDRGNSAALTEHSARFVLTAFVLRQIFSLAGFGLFLLLVLAVASLATWNVADPSLSYATDNQPTNILGLWGAVFADLMMQFFGLASLLALFHRHAAQGRPCLKGWVFQHGAARFVAAAAVLLRHEGLEHRQHRRAALAEVMLT